MGRGKKKKNSLLWHLRVLTCVKELGQKPRDELSLLGSITCCPFVSVSQVALSHLFLTDGENSHLPQRAKN